MTIEERIEYVQSLIIKAINNNDSEAIMRYHNVMYFLYKDLAEIRRVSWFLMIWMLNNTRTWL